MTIEFTEPDYQLSRDGDLLVAVHVATGIASQGHTPTEAVEMVDEAVELHQQDHEPEDEDFQREMLDWYDIIPGE